MEEKILAILEEHCEEALQYTGDNIVSDLEDEFDIEIDAKYVVAENFKNKEAIIALVRRLVEE